MKPWLKFQLTLGHHPNGHTTAYEYDLFNRLVKTTDAKGAVTQYAYDNRDNLLTLTDGEGHTSGFAYNKNNQATQETRPLGQQTGYAYDKAGNLRKKTDAKGQVIQYAYDANNRLKKADFFQAADLSTPAKTVTFDYDRLGNLTSAVFPLPLGEGQGEGVGISSFTYDARGRKTKETLTISMPQAPVLSFFHAYAYDADGRKTGMTYPDMSAYQFTYDADGQLSGYQIPNTGVISCQYLWNRPSRIVYPGGVTKRISYDPAMRITSMTVTDPGQNVLMQYAYGYDAADNITRKDTEQGPYQYVYDPANQLAAAVSPSRPAEQFTYDDVGNRTVHLKDLLVTTATYSDNNELETNGAGSYQYDANGNLTQKVEGGVTTTYSYDVQDRLVQVTDTNGLNAQYAYDVFGRRIMKDVNGVRTWFIYSDEGLIAEAKADGSITKTYGWHPDGMWGTDPVWMRVENSTAETNGYHWFTNDHLGTPQKLSTANGAVTWSAVYDAFGKAAVDPGNEVVNNLRSPGQYFDVETGLHQNWARMFDPAAGRYITADPIGYLGGINTYEYAGDNPVRFTDPLGLYSGNSWYHKLLPPPESCKGNDACPELKKKRNIILAWIGARLVERALRIRRGQPVDEGHDDAVYQLIIQWGNCERLIKEKCKDKECRESGSSSDSSPNEDPSPVGISQPPINVPTGRPSVTP